MAHAGVRLSFVPSTRASTGGRKRQAEASAVNGSLLPSLEERRSETSSGRLSAESRLFGDGWAAEDPVVRVPPHRQIVSPCGRHRKDAGSARGKGAIDVPMGGGEGSLAGGGRQGGHCRSVRSLSGPSRWRHWLLVGGLLSKMVEKDFYEFLREIFREANRKKVLHGFVCKRPSELGFGVALETLVKNLKKSLFFYDRRRR